MTFSTMARRLNAGSALPALALGAIGASMLAATPAFAQAPAGDTAPPPAPGTLTSGPNQPGTVDASQAANGGNGSGNDEIVVTGTLFRRTNTETPSPVTVLTADNLQKAGITNINDAIRSVSADSAGSISTGFQNGFSAGGSAVSLRGLGVSSTLVLIDGLRSTNYPLNDDGHNAYVDLNSINFSAIERVDVLKDGASSTYGADAIGGVVNIITKKQFVGVAGTVEGGVSMYGDGGRQRANLTVGYGDYEDTGFNVYVNGEYQHDGAIAANDRRFPFNTTDLSSIGGIDQNGADSSFGTTASQSVTATVRQTNQTDLNNPFLGGTTATGQYTAIGLGVCTSGTFTIAGAAGGVGCKHNNQTEFSPIQPMQERYSFSGRISVRLNDNIEGYVSASYAHNEVRIHALPPAIRNTQPYGGSPLLASNNPGIVLPVYVCSAGTNCATAADRRLNPNNPYAAANAVTPALGAARIFYRFGDIAAGSDRQNEVFRVATGLRGEFGDGWGWNIDAVGARDNLDLTSMGTINIAGLKQAINTGSYNFVNPALNTDAVRQAVAPTFTVGSHTSLLSLDGSVTKALFDLPGGPLQLAIGGQVRHEVEENNSLNPVLDNYANTSAAFGKHTVSAAYFELQAPILDQLEVNASGRYDHYSEGFSHFSPKIGAKFTPIKQLALRGTYSQGFRAPTFAENNPRSTFAGFVTVTPPCNFQLAHGGVSNGAGGCTTGGNAYNLPYSLGSGFSGNPDLKPEKSRSFTGGAVAQPLRWLSLTVDYYNVKKTNVIVTGPLAGTARANYFAGQPLPAGYSVAAVDAIDPLFPNALPRVLIINAPYVNAASVKTSGIDVSATATIPFSDSVKLISRVDVTDILKYTQDNGDGVIRKFVGTLGPYELSSGAGTPKWRGNWQNTLELGPLSITATTYYVSHIKEVAADENDPGADGRIDLSCDSNLYGTGDSFCYIKRFIYADLSLALKVSDRFTLNGYVGNVTNERAPIAPASYSGINYLPTWHYAGVIGRTFRAGASFRF